MTEQSVPAGRNERWVYETIVGAIPWADLSRKQATALQPLVFGLGVLAVAAVTDRWEAAPAGLAAVIVVSAGSLFMLTLGRRIRELRVPVAYIRTLFGSRIEIVLGVFSYVGLLTYLFEADPLWAGEPFLEALLGPDPSLLAVYVTLLVLWDVCYRIGTGWWASVVGLWRTIRYAEDFDAKTTDGLIAVDLLTIAFAAIQLILLPFLTEQPLLAILVAGHVAAVTLVSGTSVLLLWRSG